MLIPGGFGVRGIEGKIGAIRYAREHGIPILGLCLGLQCMVIEVARDLAGLAEADSTEFNPRHAVPGDRHHGRPGGRGGGGAGHGRHHAPGPVPGRAAARAPGWRSCTAAPWSRSGTGTGTRSTTRYRAVLEQAGLVFSGLSPDGHLVEFAELASHPFFVGHPGAPGIPVPPDPAASAVQRPDRRRPGALQGRRHHGRPAPWPAHEQHRVNIADAPEHWPVASSAEQLRTRLVTVRTDQVRMPDNQLAERRCGDSSWCRGRARSGRRGPGADDQAVPASGRQPAVGDPGGPARRRRGGRCGSPRGGN